MKQNEYTTFISHDDAAPIGTVSNADDAADDCGHYTTPLARADYKSSLRRRIELAEQLTVQLEIAGSCKSKVKQSEALAKKAALEQLQAAEKVRTEELRVAAGLSSGSAESPPLARPARKKKRNKKR